MPYLWSPAPPDGESLRLWPHRSLPPRGFATFILITFALLMLPLMPLLGTSALWMMLPFLLGALALLWLLLRRSYRDGTLTERLELHPGRVRLTRLEPGGARRDWEADPYDVQVQMHPGPVENYLTLTGGPRQVEIGAFLSPAERITLRDEIERALGRAAGYGPPR